MLSVVRADVTLSDCDCDNIDKNVALKGNVITVGL